MIIDCHNHTLPGIDDGARDVEMALAMARRATINNIAAIIVTPHHLNGVFVNRRADILNYLVDFKSVLEKSNIRLQLYPGAENHLMPELLRDLDNDVAMTLCDRGKAVLVELPKHGLPIGAEELLHQIIERGITPLIAHPERNTQLLNDTQLLKRWVDMGCRFQLTGQSCSGRFGRRIQSACRQWLLGDLIHIVASDAHRAEGREPDLNPARKILAKWVGIANMELLTEDNPARLLAGEDLRLTQSMKKAGFFSRKRL